MSEQPDEKVVERLREMGFAPGQTVYRAYRHELTIAAMQTSLFDAGYSSPKAVTVQLDQDSAPLLIVITKVAVAYEAFTDRLGDKPLGCYEYPSWQLEGWVQKSGFDPYADVVNVRIYALGQLDRPEVDSSQVYVQRITEEIDSPTTFALCPSDALE